MDRSTWRHKQPHHSAASLMQQASLAHRHRHGAPSLLKAMSGSPALAGAAGPEWNGYTLSWKRPAEVPRVQSPENPRPIVILPGFGNNSQDYQQPFGKREGSLVSNLLARGFQPYVLPVERKDWFKVARALFTLGFWRGTLTTHPGYTWYLDRVATIVDTALQETGAQQVDIIAHSAGGWLARAFLADPKYQQLGDGQPPAQTTEASSPNPKVNTLVTLGTPHKPGPSDKTRDMTGGALAWVDRSYPGAFFKDQGVRYVTVAGRTVMGHREPQKSEAKRPRLVHEYAFDSYSTVSGDGEGIIGDAVVPMDYCLLDGAERIVLDGVYHSMSRIGTFDEESGLVWYGSDDVIDCWLGSLILQNKTLATAPPLSLPAAA